MAPKMSHKKREREFKKIINSTNEYKVLAYEDGNNHIRCIIYDKENNNKFKYYIPKSPGNGASGKRSLVINQVKKAAEIQKKKSTENA
jgi:hypothetical protein